METKGEKDTSPHVMYLKDNASIELKIEEYHNKKNQTKRSKEE